MYLLSAAIASVANHTLSLSQNQRVTSCSILRGYYFPSMVLHLWGEGRMELSCHFVMTCSKAMPLIGMFMARPSARAYCHLQKMPRWFLDAFKFNWDSPDFLPQLDHLLSYRKFYCTAHRAASLKERESCVFTLLTRCEVHAADLLALFPLTS